MTCLSSFWEKHLLLPGEIKGYLVIWDTLKILCVPQEWAHNCCANPVIPVRPVCLCKMTLCDWRQADRTEQWLPALKSCSVVYQEEQVELVVQAAFQNGGHEVLCHRRVLGFTLFLGAARSHTAWTWGSARDSQQISKAKAISRQTLLSMDGYTLQLWKWMWELPQNVFSYSE